MTQAAVINPAQIQLCVCVCVCVELGMKREERRRRRNDRGGRRERGAREPLAKTERELEKDK